MIQRYTIAAVTHRGRVRRNNEDHFAVDGAIYGGSMGAPVSFESASADHTLLVADGMGGHAAGELASRIALEALLGWPEALTKVEACASALFAANDRIYDEMKCNHDTVGMGTTIIGAVMSSRHLLFFNVGDSRLYRHRRACLTRLSEDDVPAFVESGSFRTSHEITQALGGHSVHAPILPHIGVGPTIESGDSLLLCSDGLTDMVSESIICNLLDALPETADCVCELLQIALSSGGSDNITIIVLRVT